MILEDVVGKQRAQATRVEFDPDWPILLARRAFEIGIRLRRSRLGRR